MAGITGIRGSKIPILPVYVAGITGIRGSKIPILPVYVAGITGIRGRDYRYTLQGLPVYVAVNQETKSTRERHKKTKRLHLGQSVRVLRAKC